MKSDEDYMRQAIAVTLEGIKAGQTPFGAVIVKDGTVIAKAHNVVWEDGDITAHAEITALRQACKGTSCIDLSGATVYSTTEPCPMCFSACHWARVKRIVYGASIADARKAGFNELAISDEDMKRMGGSGVELSGGVLKKECRELFEVWKKAGGRTY